MKFLPSASKRAYVVGATLFVLMAVFGFYLLIYLPNRENKIIQQRVRALNQIAESFKEKREVYQKNAIKIENYYQQDLTRIKKLGDSLRNDISVLASQIKIKDSLLSVGMQAAQQQEGSGSKKALDVQLLELEQQKKELESKKKKLDSIAYRPIREVNARIKQDAVNKSLEIAESKVDTSSNLIFVSNISEFSIKTSVGSFFKSLAREDVFDEYIIYKNKSTQPAYQTTQGSLFLITDTPADKGQKNTQSTKNLVPIARDTSFGDIVDVKLGTIDYKLFSTSFSTDKTDWNIYGLVSKEKFEAEKRSVPPLLIISLSVMLLLIVFAMPLMKLIFMSSIERLHQRNVIHSAVSFILSFGLLILCILALDSYFVDTNNSIDKNLQSLSNKIKNDFNAEIDAVSALIDTFDQGSFRSDSLKNNSISIYSEMSDKSLKSLIRTYPFFDYIYWMDPTGRVKYEYAAATNKSGQLDSSEVYGERNYFQAIHNKAGWYLSNANKGTSQYMIESILSWDKGENSAVISKSSGSSFDNNKAEVVAVSGSLYSVIDPVLPPGYQFCVMDEQGKVLFHSDKRRNLQENYIEECNQESSIISAIQGNASTFANLYYNKKDQRAYIQSLDKVPWYVITTFDKSYSHSPYSQIIVFTLFSMIFISFVVACISCVTYLLYYTPSKLKKVSFSFEWLRPQAKMKPLYLLVLALNASYLLALLIYNALADITALQTLVSFTYAILLSYTFSFSILQQKKDLRYYVFIVLTLALILLIFGMAALLRGIIWKDIILLLVLMAIPCVLFSAMFYRGHMLNITHKMVALFSIKDFKRAYMHMLFSFLLMSSVLPTVFLFMKFYEQEMLIWGKASLFQVSKDLEKKDNEVHIKYASLPLEDRNALTDLIKDNGLHCKALGYHRCEGSDATLTASKYDTILYKIRPFFNALIVNNNGFIFPYSENRKWQTTKKDNKIIFTYDQYPDKQEAIALALPIPYFFNFDTDHLDFGNIVFLLIMIGTLLGMYLALRFAVKKFFTWDLLSEKEIFRVDDKYLYECRYLEKMGTRQNLFIISLPFAGIQSLRKKTGSSNDIIQKFKGQPAFSLSQIYDQKNFDDIYSQAKEMKETAVVLEHFGYNAKNIVASNRKLQLIETLLLNGNNIIIISGIRPVQIIELYENLIENYEKLSKEEKEKVNKNDYIDIINRWKDILSGFVKIYPSPEINRKLKPAGTVEELIAYECSANAYFDRVQESLADLSPATRAATDKKTKEEVLLKLQSMAQSFYFSLWNTCTKEEKYLLYDLATDDFVNTKNIQGIILLIEKGLVYYDHDEQLHVMNESFRNFILTNVKKSEALEMEKELMRTGTWSIFKAVIIVLVVSMLLFVSFAEQTFLDNFLAILAGLTAIVSYMLRLGGWFVAPSGTSIKD